MSDHATIYMLHADDSNYGPFTGPPGLDFHALAAEFRAQRYAQSESQREDHCWISTGDFVGWLVDRKILVALEATHVEIDIETTGDNAYAPGHWPLCPACGEGRCDKSWDMRTLRREFNRVEAYRECQKCGHQFDRHDEPFAEDHPMLDDDGRYTASGCVPYAISQVSGLPFDHVLAACRIRGWTEDEGMLAEQGIALMREFGLIVRRGDLGTGKLTLRRFLDNASPDKRYIVATRDHWLAVVLGRNCDSTDTAMRAVVYEFWEVEGDAREVDVVHGRKLETCS